MQKLFALDLYCGGGGACIGLQQAGFEVVGIDIEPHPRYPGHFICGDVLSPPIVSLDAFDFIFASPPCQAFSLAGLWCKDKKNHPNLIPQTRALLADHPWSCIENVMQAPLRQNLVLCGQHFSLNTHNGEDRLWRKRAFELSFFAWQPPIPKMPRGYCTSIAGTFSENHHFHRRKQQGKRGSVPTSEAKTLMGIPPEIRMIREDIKDAVPPPYARYIGLEVQARMQESGYVSVWDRRNQKHYREALESVEKLQDVPF